VIILVALFLVVILIPRIYRTRIIKIVLVGLEGIGEECLISGQRVVANLRRFNKYIPGIVRKVCQKYRRLAGYERDAFQKDFLHA
jgi:hypothetical protein